MIAAYDIQEAPLGAAELIYRFRKTVATQFEERRRKFQSIANAKAEIKREMKRILIEQLTGYVTHCGNIIKGSNYPAGSKWKSYNKCLELLAFAKGRNGLKTLKEVSLFVLMNKNNLVSLLPHSANKGFATAEGNLIEIITQAQAYSKRKRATQMCT